MNNLNGQIIEGLYRCSDEDSWALLKTNHGTFELRVGGVKQTTEKPSAKNSIDLPVQGRTIKEAKTDDFHLYFELENGECLVHSDTWINGDGNIDFEVRLIGKSEFEIDKKEWYDTDSDLKEIEY